LFFVKFLNKLLILSKNLVNLLAIVLTKSEIPSETIFFDFFYTSGGVTKTFSAGKLIFSEI
jgi:hypothetical protein